MMERLTWSEMVKKYPDRWLMLNGCETSLYMIKKMLETL